MPTEKPVNVQYNPLVAGGYDTQSTQEQIDEALYPESPVTFFNFAQRCYDTLNKGRNLIVRRRRNDGYHNELDLTKFSPWYIVNYEGDCMVGVIRAIDRPESGGYAIYFNFYYIKNSSETQYRNVSGFTAYLSNQSWFAKNKVLHNGRDANPAKDNNNRSCIDLMFRSNTPVWDNATIKVIQSTKVTNPRDMNTITHAPWMNPPEITSIKGGSRRKSRRSKKARRSKRIPAFEKIPVLNLEKSSSFLVLSTILILKKLYKSPLVTLQSAFVIPVPSPPIP